MAITQITLNGAQICDYIWYVNRPLTEDETEFVSDMRNEPVWTFDTGLLVTFNKSLMAGNITDGSSSPTSWKIYRHELDDDTMTLAGLVPATSIEFVDYNVSNRKTFEYVLFAETEGYIADPLTTDRVDTNWSNWCLFDVNEKEDDPDTYEINEAFIFNANISSSPMSNNMVVGKYPNFTAFPKVIKSNSDYLSGTLTGYLGRFDCENNEGKYYEDVDDGRRLRDFALRPNLKFLKDVRGHIWLVEVTEPLTFESMVVGSYNIYNITIGWSEVARADKFIINGV